VSEFDLINQYFKSAPVKRNDVVLGIGDDCALLSPPAGKQLAVSTDTLISGVHFPENTHPADIAYKALAVNLSDLAAMGAEPAWVSLAISLPEPEHQWLEQFMQGFNQLAQQYNIALVGGDTTRGPLSITVNVSGFVEASAALKRSAAKPGDQIFVSGTPGDARAGLEILLSKKNAAGKTLHTKDLDYLLGRLNRPSPRVSTGQLLAALSAKFGEHNAIAAIDLSDGLLADLAHICKASGVGAALQLESLPLSTALKNYSAKQPDWQKILNAGDDYELCFTCAQSHVDELLQSVSATDVLITRIGEINQENTIDCYYKDQLCEDIKPAGYNHFNIK